MGKQFKRIFIIFIYLILFLLLVFGAYHLFRNKETCFDNIKNQNEEGIDCGGICAKKCDKIEARDLIIEKSGFVSSGITGKYDFYAQIQNPNAIFGSQKFGYVVNFLDLSGAIVATKAGSGFILPGERKYIVENNVEIGSVPASVNVQIKNPDWVEFNDYYEKPDIKIINKNYNEISGGVGFSEAKGLLKNDSPFDFDTIKIQVLLKDANDQALAINSTEMSTVKAGEERDFRVFWPNHFPGVPSNMEVQAEVNVFNSDTFLKRFYQAHKFQAY